MSIVFYKFKSAKDYDTCTFDGTNISVFDLKREIMQAKKLGKGTDFDLMIYNAQTNEEYKDDMYMIPRNTSVLVSRHPASKPGKGTAQRYLTTAMPTGAMLAGSWSRGAPQAATSLPKHHSLNNRLPQQRPPTSTDTPATEITGETEEERIANMFKLQTEQWAVAQDKMAQQKPIPRQYHGAGRGGWRGGHHNGGDRNQAGGEGGGWQQREYPQRAPPPGYICYRCGQKGHFINQCPTIGDKDFDRPKLKRTTGIPKIFLKVVDDKQAAGGGVMVTQNGELVVAQPNEQAWANMAARTRNYLGAGDVHEMAPVPSELACPLCTKLLRDAVLIPCCGTSYCDECIRAHLLDNEDPEQRLKCPNCGSDQSPDNLVPNKSLRQAVEHHIRDFAAKKAGGPPSPVPANATAASVNAQPAEDAASATPTVNGTASAAPPTQTTTVAPPSTAPIVPAINRPPTTAKPYKIIKPTNATPATTTSNPTPPVPNAAPIEVESSDRKPTITPIRKISDSSTPTVSARPGLKRGPDEAGVNGEMEDQYTPDGTDMNNRRVRRGSLTHRYQDFEEYPPHMMVPDFDPRWGGPGPMMPPPPPYGRFWDGPPHMFPPPPHRRGGYGMPPPDMFGGPMGMGMGMGMGMEMGMPPVDGWRGEMGGRDYPRDRGYYPPGPGSSGGRMAVKRPRNQSDVIDVTSKHSS
ncbi:cleavage polyadenylation factor subunit MPE1 [Spizellomyces punctatus DAOM BR117]|uniref:DWNN domain-containing protein n=1 Tax=Spizellomyces punctatus (strain DAOM BR117) TaxID=645134 RepID=A0A0L0HBB0_SPIPD|nr:cleavage polyadenylation factor subunit MPE1 [Spizellomyces punctatus DAOM BR117]KNC98149.1 hypothetical protein SPPG_06553 [Spizellomyces punctatus DAOM BR117]|eukprot:XP_016606189.1 hypothetical protein SPPG_06553 [Spizellomyces punctatus DAOM BR117]